MAEKKQSKTSTERDKLATELKNLVRELDSESLIFLIRQANILLHNKRVDELNAKADAAANPTKKKERKAGTTARVNLLSNEITVEVQQSADRKNYYLIIDGRKHFLDPPEMEKVVKLCFKPDRKSAAIKYLFQFLDNERKEILMDHDINSPKHPFFEALFYETRARFSLDE